VDIRKSIVSRIAIIYFILLLFGIAVIFKMVSVQQIKNERWAQIAKNLEENTLRVQPNRGNICADDGSVLATSVPGYFVRMKLTGKAIADICSLPGKWTTMNFSKSRNFPYCVAGVLAGE
jgi:cell division protein FtsI (penicillin-binding protein 3)